MPDRGEESDIQGACLRFGTRPSHMQEVGRTIRIAVSGVLRQQDLCHRVGGYGVEVRRAIKGARSKDVGVYIRKSKIN